MRRAPGSSHHPARSDLSFVALVQRCTSVQIAYNEPCGLYTVSARRQLVECVSTAPTLDLAAAIILTRLAGSHRAGPAVHCCQGSVPAGTHHD